MSTAHWATPLIHTPYERGASGPDSFDCWGLVRYVFEHVHGITMPAVAVGEEGANIASIKTAAGVSGWRRSRDHLPAVNDIVIMTGFEGRHVGVMVEANDTMLILHSLEGVGVCAQPLSELSRMGFRDFEFWRHRA